MANSLVQSKAGSAVSAIAVGPNQILTATAAFDAPTTPGNLLVMVVYTTIRGAGCSAPNTPNNPTTPGIAWQFPSGARWFNPSPRAQGWVFLGYAWNAPSIAPSVITTATMSTMTSSGSNDFRLEVKLYEFGGVLNTADPLDVLSLVPGGSGTTPSAGTLNTTDIDLVIAMFTSDPGANIAAGPGFTLGLSATAASVGQTQYQLNAPAGAVSTAFGGTEPLWKACAIAFKPSVTPPPPTPALQVAPPALSFFAVEGGANPTAQSLAVTNGNGGTLNWAVTSDRPWITPAPLSGVDAGTIFGNVNITGLVAGVYNANLTVTAVGATGSPTIIPVTLNITVQPPPPPTTCPFTLGDADAALAARLYDTSGQFWPQSERFACIRETLRTWNALTGYWRADFTFPANAASPWYDLTQVANTLRPLTVTDAELLLRMEQDLLEPATSAYPLLWAGSAQFAIADLLGALGRRRDDLLGLTGCAITRSVVAAAPGRIQLPSTTAELRRVAFLPDANLGAVPSVVWQDDLWSLNAYAPGWTTDDPGIPDSYRQSTTPPRSFEVKPQPGIPASYELLTIDNGADLTTAAATVLGVPDDWTWVIKWGALADLLSRESNAKDTVRAKYCEVRYRQGIALLTAAPALLGMRINNVPMRVDGVASADRYRTSWQGEDAGTPEVALVAGLNLVAMCPEPDDANTTFTATVVRNAPLPTVVGDCVTLPRDLFDVMLDYAQHLASFKMGGAEFLATLPLLERFMQAASYYNSKLAEQGEYMKTLYALSGRDAALLPRYSEASPEDTT